VAATNCVAGSVTVLLPQLQSAFTGALPAVLEHTCGVVTPEPPQYFRAESHASAPPPPAQVQVVSEPSDSIQNLLFVQAPRRLDCMKAGAAEVTATSATNTQRVAFICIV